MYSRNYRDLFIRYLAPQWPQVLLLTLLLSSNITLQLLNPQLVRSFIDTVSSRGSTIRSSSIVALFIGTALLQQIITIFMNYVSEYVGWKATNSLRLDLTSYLMQLDMPFFEKNTPGGLIERVDGDITVMTNFFSQFVILILGNGVLLTGILIMLVLQCWQAGVALTVFTLLALLFMLCIRNLAVRPWQSYRQACADLFGFLEERINGIEDIRTSGAIPYVMFRFYHYVRQQMHTSQRAQLRSVTFWSASFIVRATGTIVSFGLIIWLYRSGAMTLGLAFLIFLYAQIIFSPMEVLTAQLNELQKTSASFTRVNELFQIKRSIKDGPGVNFAEGALSVEFDHLSFSYDEETMILKDVSFTLQPGEVLGLLGRTGSGKTTITRLLLRHYDPAVGTIRLGGYNLRETKQGDLHGRIGMVTQNVQLFRASIRDNLAFFDRAISEERILAALEALGMFEWLKRLPYGLDTMLTPNGGGLSAGEAQLLAFARVFLKEPAIVILDEATSRLDPVTEKVLEQATERLLRGRTAIIIAHRLSTVKHADTIMILEQGQISEYGPREQLLANSGSRFSQLLLSSREEVLL